MSPLLRRVFCWKFAFYEVFLPLLRTLGPSRCDVVLRRWDRSGHEPGRDAGGGSALRWSDFMAFSIWTGGSRTSCPSWQRIRHGFWPATTPSTAARMQGSLNVLKSSGAKASSERVPRAKVRSSWAATSGLTSRGCTGCFASGCPFGLWSSAEARLARLNRWFDDDRELYAQPTFFLQRNLPRASAIELLIRARPALRDGLSLYLCGDIPWPGPNASPGRLLGCELPFLATWAELAVLARAPVFHVFCTHLPGGRFRLELESAGQVHAGEEHDAVADYLKELEARIANEPAHAVAHLLWPCFQPSVTDPSAPSARLRSTHEASQPTQQDVRAARAWNKQPGSLCCARCTPRPTIPACSGGIPDAIDRAAFLYACSCFRRAEGS